MQATLFGRVEYIMFDWIPEQRTLLHLVNLKTGKRKEFDAPAFFTFHYINTFESTDGKFLCFDFSHFEDPGFLNGYYLDNLRQHMQPAPKSPVV
jgi:carotenoid cleavage dioxygenase-like enzyme